MRNVPNLKAERYRVRVTDESGNNGYFRVPQKGGPALTVIVSDGSEARELGLAAAEGWEHVSVSTPHRCPTWEEMCLVKELFFRDDEWVFQLHPPKSENISNHPYCLHLWRYAAADPPRPPAWMVGVKGLDLRVMSDSEVAMLQEQALGQALGQADIKENP